jgi:hypothetical protein
MAAVVRGKERQFNLVFLPNFAMKNQSDKLLLYQIQVKSQAFKNEI